MQSTWCLLGDRRGVRTTPDRHAPPSQHSSRSGSMTASRSAGWILVQRCLGRARGSSMQRTLLARRSTRASARRRYGGFDRRKCDRVAKQGFASRSSASLATQSDRRITMLQKSPMYAYLPAKDVKRAKAFYEQKVGLKAKEERNGGVVFEFGDHTGCFMYPTPFAGTSQASQAFWQV